MPYKVPGAYARFVKTASPVANAGASRIMALVGTGLNYYEVYNETVARQSDRPFDTLTHENVFEIISISSKAIYSGKNNPTNVIYNQGVDFDLKDGKNIVWRTLDNEIQQPTLVNVDTDPFINEGSRAFANNCTYVVDVNNSYFVQDGQWRIEVTYPAKDQGCYRIINVDTNELLGEFVCGDTVNTTIPGINLKVKSTYKLPTTSSVDSDDNLVATGDYFIIKTVAGKTEKEATAVMNTKSSVIGLRNSVTKVNIINDGRVVNGQYKIIMKSAITKEFQVVSVDNSQAIPQEQVIYPDASDATKTAVWVSGNEIYDIIPGVEVILGDFKYTPADNDAVVIDTSARVVDSTLPGEGDSYYVSYKYRKASSGYDAKLFSDYDKLVAEYGNYEVTASGFVKNSLSLGAEIAFKNGIQQIICVEAKGTSDAEFCDAIDKLKRTLPGVSNVNTVVPLSTSVAVGAYCANHVDTMSSYEMGKERMTYLGAFMNQPLTKQPSGKDRTMGIIETCEGYNNERVVFVAPGEVVKSIRDINTGKSYDRTLPGCYLAVAVASIGLKNDPAEPLTNKTITGFSYLPTSYMESELNLMAGAGACLLIQSGNNIIIRHGITTSVTEVNSMEITLIQIKDYVIEACRTACGKLYIGRKNTASAVSDVNYTITNILNQFISQEIIVGYSNLSVKRSTEDPRQIDVKFEIEAVYPLNYINISFGFSAVK